MMTALIDATHHLLPLAARSSSPPPINPFDMMPWGFFMVIMLANLVFMVGAGVVGYYIAKKYEMEPWLGAAAGFFLTWIGILIVFLVGNSQQQARERKAKEKQYADWWYANYGPQAQNPYGAQGNNPYSWNGNPAPPSPPQPPNQP
ncbi:MAG: hypothetical protein H6839_10095 [Planctomycetes bacterium]|nr:hypothetical protein [Planctomycetota bacterium]